MAEISQQLGIHVITLYKWRKAWPLQGELMPACQKDPEGWGSADKFSVVLVPGVNYVGGRLSNRRRTVLETARLNSTELVPTAVSGACSPGRCTAGVMPPRDANAQPLLTMADQKVCQELHQEDQRQIKLLQQQLRHREKLLAEAAALLIAKNLRRTGQRTRGINISRGAT